MNISFHCHYIDITPPHIITLIFTPLHINIEPLLLLHWDITPPLHWYFRHLLSFWCFRHYAYYIDITLIAIITKMPLLSATILSCLHYFAITLILLFFHGAIATLLTPYFAITPLLAFSFSPGAIFIITFFFHRLSLLRRLFIAAFTLLLYATPPFSFIMLPLPTLRCHYWCRHFEYHCHFHFDIALRLFNITFIIFITPLFHISLLIRHLLSLRHCYFIYIFAAAVDITITLRFLWRHPLTHLIHTLHTHIINVTNTPHHLFNTIIISLISLIINTSYHTSLPIRHWLATHLLITDWLMSIWWIIIMSLIGSVISLNIVII